MAITVNDKDLGLVTAYAYAVSKGYTGTEAEFAELMASYADVAQQAAASASSAATSATNAAGSAQAAATSATQAAAAATTEVANRAVRYDAAQTLNDTQKAQARGNIDAASTGAVDDLKSAVTNLTDETNIFDNSTAETTGFVIFADGHIEIRSSYKSVAIPIKPNETYRINSTLGEYLSVGTYTQIVDNATATNFEINVPGGKTATITTGENDNFLLVVYWTNTSTQTEAQIRARLEVYLITARDEYARDEIAENKHLVNQSIADFYNDVIAKSQNLYDPSIHCKKGYGIATTGALSGNGGYTDRCVIGYIPVHGFDSVNVAVVSDSLVSDGRYCWYDEAEHPIQLSGQSTPAIGGIPLSGVKNASTLSVPTNAYYVAFQLYYANSTLDENGCPILMVTNGNGYPGYSQYGGTVLNPKYSSPKDIYVCAKDSDEKYRINADYFCSGNHDENILQTALEACGFVGTLWLAPGTYSIDSIPLREDGQYCALQYRTKINGVIQKTRVRIRCYDQTPMREEGYSIINRCATLKVSADCYNALDTNTNYSVIGVETADEGVDMGRVWNGACFDLSGIGIQIPGNQKKIVAFDAWNAFCIAMDRCMATAIPINGMPSSAGVDDCVGLKCTMGSNFGQESLLTSCAMYGFGQGVAVSGEHYVLTNCKTIYNKYGFTFNWYGDNNAGYTHPNTLINCCSEMDFNYPYFGYNGQLSSVTLIDFNMEYRNASAALGGELAQERIPGTWRGSINYTIKTYGSDGYDSGNNVTFPFWKSGHGANVKSHNDAQKQICTTSERNSYAANEMQRVYDSTAEKFYTYVNGAWVEG